MVEVLLHEDLSFEPQCYSKPQELWLASIYGTSNGRAGRQADQQSSLTSCLNKSTVVHSTRIGSKNNLWESDLSLHCGFWRLNLDYKACVFHLLRHLVDS